MTTVAYALGRICIPIVFIVAGLHKLLNVGQVASDLAAARIPVPDEITTYLGGMPKYQAVGYLVGAIEVICGLMVLLGFKARWGAVALIVFTVAATFFFHNFWDMTGDAYLKNQVHALKNLAILGGLLLVVAGGSRGTSWDGRPTA